MVPKLKADGTLYKIPLEKMINLDHPICQLKRPA
jgi:hypothetical protein